MRTHIFNHMTAREIDDYLASGKSAIFVALGSTGAHGSLPVDAEVVMAEGLATVLAEKCGALVLTGLPFFYPGSSVISSGTVYTSMRDGFEYIWKILVSLTNQGFKELFLVPGSEEIAVFLRALTRDFFEQTHYHPIIIELKSVLSGAKKHDSSVPFTDMENRRRYAMEAEAHLRAIVPDDAAYEKLICGAYSVMGKKDQLIVDPELKNVEPTELDPAAAELLKRVTRMNGSAPTLYDDPGKIPGGCVFRTVEERDRVCDEYEKKLRGAVDILDLDHLLEVVRDYQEYALEVCEKFPRFNKLAEG